tara:strand:+ start:28120 stop:28590 length:471 start_codon:yes stop_codon:yes gene_type:complete
MTDPRQLPHGHELQAQRILSSFRRIVGRELIDSTGSITDDAKRLFTSPFVVVSAGAEPDPILNYGNATALHLWEMSWDQLTQTPGRHTAEPMHRHERERFLAAVHSQGYIEDYSGIRISSTGKRFEIHKAIVWNLADENGEPRGQAATFRHWTFLD